MELLSFYDERKQLRSVILSKISKQALQRILLNLERITFQIERIFFDLQRITFQIERITFPAVFQLKFRAIKSSLQRIENP